MPNRQVPFLIGLLVLSLGTALICVGSSIGLFIAGRILQGISASLVWIVGLALLVDTVGKEEVAGYMGFVSMAMSLGILLGPLLGGIVYHHGGYYAVFGMAFGLLAFDILLRLVIIERKTAARYRSTAKSTTIGREEEILSDLPVTRGTDEAPSSTNLALIIVAAKTSPWKDRIPVTVRLLNSGRLLVALFSTIVIAIIATGFDAVSSSLFQYLVRC